MSEEKLPDEFTVYLFSNGSDSIYPNNKLNCFTQQLAESLRFDLNSEFYVGLSELFVENVHKNTDKVLTKDSIFFYGIHIGYAENIWKNHVNTLEFLIMYCLSQTDYTVYNDQYFADFLNPYFDYQCGHLLLEESWFERVDMNSRKPITPKILPEFIGFDVDFGLKEGDFLYNYQNTKIDKGEKFRHFARGKMSMKFRTALPYTLKMILCDLIYNIIIALTPYTLNIHLNYTLEQTLNDSDPNDIVWTNFKDVKDFGENIKEYKDNVNLFIRHFIQYFISLVKKYQKKHGYTEESILYKQVTPSYLIVYVDIVSESIINNTKGRILAVIPVSHLEDNFISVKNINYSPVISSEFRTISCVLMTEFGSTFPLEASYVPTYLALRFKRFSN